MTSINRQTKEEAVKKLTVDLQNAKSLALVDFAKMNIGAQLELKKKLKEAKSKMLVAKNTLLKIAIVQAKYPTELTTDEILSGQTAIIIGQEDPVSPIQAFGKFLSQSEGIEKFKAGFVDGNFADENTLMQISKLPSKDVLVGQTVGAIAGPLYGLVSNLQASMQELIGILSAKAVS